MWKKHIFPHNEGIKIHRFGNSLLYIALDQAGEGTILSSMVKFEMEKTSHKSRELPALTESGWHRAFTDKAQEYELQPAYPKIPVCIHFNDDFYLSPGQILSGWVFSTLEASVTVNSIPLTTHPLINPYKTLYGMPDSGVICRYDETAFLASGEAMMDALHADLTKVAHPVLLKNMSAETVRVSELCIYGEQLSIFGDGTRFQSESLIFTFSSFGVRMRMDSRLSIPQGSRLVARPRVSGEERFIERSFELFKAITRI